jgi:RHS repeat-associated protein
MLEFTRDPKGRVTQTSFKGLTSLSSMPEFTQSYDYDYVGNLLSMQSSFGNLFYSYNGNNQLTALSNSSGDNFSFNYDDVGRLTRLTRPNGYSDFSYNNSGQLASIEHRLNGVIKSFNQYQYDQRNFITQKTTQAAAFDYQYDNNSQLISATNPLGATENFTYDNLGNRLTDNSGSYSYDTKFQKLQSDALFNYFYDNNGNLIRKYPKDTTKPAYKYTYSSTNQLIRFEVLENMAGQVIKQADYKYDVLGRRIQKQVTDLQNSSSSFTRRYLYNGDNIFIEMDEDNDVLARYTYSHLTPDDFLSADITSDGQSAGLAQVSGKYYALKDHLNSITDFSNTTGNVVQSYQYTSFGKIVSIKDGSGVDVSSSPKVSLSFTYTGRELDAESGIYYYRARFYDSSIGRFLQADPDPGKISLPSTLLTKYIYTANNPVMHNDPTGRFGIIAAIVISGLVAGGVTALMGGTTEQIINSMLFSALSTVVVLSGAWVAIAISGAATGTTAAVTWGAIGGSLANMAFGYAMGAKEFASFAMLGVTGLLGGGFAGKYGFNPLPSKDAAENALSVVDAQNSGLRPVSVDGFDLLFRDHGYLAPGVPNSPLQFNNNLFQNDFQFRLMP